MSQVVQGFRSAFSLCLVGHPKRWRDPPNGQKVCENPVAAWDLIRKEIQKGAILVPFRERPVPDLLCSSINIVKKEMSSGSFCLIQDLSYCYVWGCSGQHRSRAFSWLSRVATFAQRGEPIPPVSVGRVTMNQPHTCFREAKPRKQEYRWLNTQGSEAVLKAQLQRRAGKNRV